jgi:hypothetical protein
VRATAIFNGQSPEVFDSLDVATVRELELMYRDGMIGARHNLMLISHLMTIVFPHLEEYFVPPNYMTRQERDFLTFTSLPGFKAEFLEILGGNRGG